MVLNKEPPAHGMNGYKNYACRCFTCTSAERNRIQPHIQRRSEWLREKKSAPCMDCKKIYNPAVMQFDHVRGKNFQISLQIYNKSLSALEKEIELCDLVCANCHALRTFYRKQYMKGI